MARAWLRHCRPTQGGKVMGKSLKDATGGDVMGTLDTGGPDVWFIDVDDDGTAYTWCASAAGPAYLPEDEIQHVRDYHAGKFCVWDMTCPAPKQPCHFFPKAGN